MVDNSWSPLGIKRRLDHLVVPANTNTETTNPLRIVVVVFFNLSKYRGEAGHNQPTAMRNHTMKQSNIIPTNRKYLLDIVNRHNLLRNPLLERTKATVITHRYPSDIISVRNPVDSPKPARPQSQLDRCLLQGEEQPDVIRLVHKRIRRLQRTNNQILHIGENRTPVRDCRTRWAIVIPW